jgi:glycosyltransferase involved in cell wall biosynthesis
LTGESISAETGADVTIGIPTRNRSEWLRVSIASVLEQRYENFELLVSDNASDDDTADVVSSFQDPRIVYLPLDHDIGRHANVSRLIELSSTEFFVLLGDDDELLPDHLSSTVEALRRWPSVGVAHTGCAVVDTLGNTLNPHVRLMKSRDQVTFESGSQFRERSMTSGWTVCLSSATFRKEALVRAGGLRPEDGVIDDLPLLMRISTDWDFAYVNRPLALMRVHPDASSSSLGFFTPRGFRSSHDLPNMLYERRRQFLDETDIPEIELLRLRRLAEKEYRRDRVRHLSMRANTGDGLVETTKALGLEIRKDRRIALEPATWRFALGQLGARRLRNGIRRAVKAARR